jgi:hypothetical protein
MTQTVQVELLGGNLAEQIDSLKMGLMLNTFDDLVDHGRTLVASPVIIADEFEDALGIDAGNSTGETYNAAGYVSNPMVANVVVSAGTEWTGSGNFSYGAGTIAGSGGGGIAAKCLTTFPSDFKFQFDYASAITNKMINFYFVNAAAAASFNAANASGGVGGAPAAGNGFLVQCANSGTKPNITDINSAGLYLGVNTANGQLYEVERIGATITLRQAGTIIHTFSMTDITEELTVIISTASQAGYSFNSNNVQWTTYSAAPALDVRSVGVTMASAPNSGFFCRQVFTVRPRHRLRFQRWRRDLGHDNSHRLWRLCIGCLGLCWPCNTHGWWH